MTTEIALSLLAASIPITALILRFASMVNPMQFVRLETQFEMFQQEVRKELASIRKIVENYHEK